MQKTFSKLGAVRARGRVMLEPALKCLWTCATAVGTRKLGWLVSRISTYSDTAFYFEGVEGVVALTIDDGLARGGVETSLVSEVLSLLERHDARCTFFVCSKYLASLGADRVVAAGHEFGNHMEEDKFGYSKLVPDEFERALKESNDVIEAESGATVRWFRAPQGVLTSSMRRAIVRLKLRHAIGDAYCDDWAVSDADWVARTLLRQAKAGSIVILHMPERGHREHTLEALTLVLQGLSDRGLKCVTLTEIEAKAKGAREIPVEVL